MTRDIFFALFQDGVVVGALYVLIALSLVMVFSVTRVILISFGEFVAFGALTLASLQQDRFPPTVWLLLGLGIVCAVKGLIGYVKGGWRRADLLPPVLDLSAAVALALAARWVVSLKLGMIADVPLTLAIVCATGPFMYRIAFEPLQKASVLTLLIAAMSVHTVLIGLGLYLFGPEGVRTEPFSDALLEISGVFISGQNVIVLISSLALLVVLHRFFGATMTGKSLRATADSRLGARLMGIRERRSGQQVFFMAAFVGAAVGVLIAPTTTVFYDTGFLLVLKGFVAAVFGGLLSYPLSALAALFIGITETYATFWASSYKEVIVFTLLLPALAWRSMGSRKRGDRE